MIKQLRLLVRKAAWLLYTVGHKSARIEVAAIKAAISRTAAPIVDHAIQVHSGLGLSGDKPIPAQGKISLLKRCTEQTTARHDK